MDTLQALDFAIYQADEAAALLGVAADQITERLRAVNRIDRPERSAYAANASLGALVTIATAHREDCSSTGCATCVAIRDALAANLAGLRTLRLDALERPGGAGSELV